MNTLSKCTILVTLFLANLAPRAANAQDKFYFWVVPFADNPAITTLQSFVIEVNASQRSEIEAIYAKRHAPQFLGHVAVGAVPYNKNYHAPGNPVWHWHISSVEKIYDQADGPFYWPPEDEPNTTTDPSDIEANPEQWVAQHGHRYFPTRYYIRTEIDPAKRDAMANVSNRALAGPGEKTLITGFIISGGQPRTVVVRALSPSLSAAGIQQPASNPKLDVFRGSANIASNLDWKQGARADSLAEWYPAVAPTNENEAALLLTLLPGAYTLHGANEEPAEGIAVLEVYDVDAVPRQRD